MGRCVICTTLVPELVARTCALNRASKFSESVPVAYRKLLSLARNERRRSFRRGGASGILPRLNLLSDQVVHE